MLTPSHGARWLAIAAALALPGGFLVISAVWLYRWIAAR